MSGAATVIATMRAISELKPDVEVHAIVAACENMPSGTSYKPGDILTLDGDLGAGKTAFTGGLAKGIGINGYVTSPTFTIVNEYRNGTMPLFHFDVYRLESMDDLYDIGWEDYLTRNGVCAVEWSENIEDALEEDIIKVDIRRGSDDNQRQIMLTNAPGEMND